MRHSDHCVAASWTRVRVPYNQLTPTVARCTSPHPFTHVHITHVTHITHHVIRSRTHLSPVRTRQQGNEPYHTVWRIHHTTTTVTHTCITSHDTTHKYMYTQSMMGLLHTVGGRLPGTSGMNTAVCLYRGIGGLPEHATRVHGLLPPNFTLPP